MKIKIEFKSDDLKSIVNRASRFTTSRGIIPEFSYFVIEGKELRASNGICGIFQRLPVDFGPDKVFLPAELFSQAVSNLSDPIILTQTGPGKTVVLNSGSFQTKFQQPKNFEKDSVWFSVPDTDVMPLPDDFFGAMYQTFFVVPKQSSLSAVKFEKNVFYATDAQRMTRFKYSGHAEYNIDIPEVLLALLVGETMPLLGYAVFDNKIWFFFDEFIAFTCVLDSELPDFEGAFKKFDGYNLSADVSFDQEKTMKVFDHLSFFHSQDGVDVCIIGDKMVLSAKHISLVKEGKGLTNEGLENVAEVTSTADGVFSLNQTFFKEAITRSKKFRFNPTDHRLPIHFVSESGLDIVVMPLVGSDDERAEVLRKCTEYLSEAAEAGAETRVGAEAAGETSETKEA
jgi:DNA polymerase III sliding clamp (beta) subunit (PCNA family)